MLKGKLYYCVINIVPGTNRLTWHLAQMLLGEEE